MCRLGLTDSPQTQAHFFQSMENVERLDIFAHEALERGLKLEYISEGVNDQTKIIPQESALSSTPSTSNNELNHDDISSFQKIYDGIRNSFLEWQHNMESV